MKIRILVVIVGVILCLCACESANERVVDQGIEYVGKVKIGEKYQLIFTDDNGNTYDYYVGSLNWLPELKKGELYDVQTYRSTLDIDYRVENVFKNGGDSE